MTDSPPTDGRCKANREKETLLEILTRCRRQACFRYPVDGPTRSRKPVNDAIERRRGPRPTDSPYSEWLCKLRRNPVISAAMAATSRPGCYDDPSQGTLMWGHSLAAQGLGVELHFRSHHPG
jgi:hypothetical protein